jgi:hypothetical protein
MRMGEYDYGGGTIEKEVAEHAEQTSLESPVSAA